MHREVVVEVVDEVEDEEEAEVEEVEEEVEVEEEEIITMVETGEAKVVEVVTVITNKDTKTEIKLITIIKEDLRVITRQKQAINNFNTYPRTKIKNLNQYCPSHNTSMTNPIM